MAPRKRKASSIDKTEIMDALSKLESPTKREVRTSAIRKYLDVRKKDIGSIWKKLLDLTLTGHVECIPKKKHFEWRIK